MTTCAQLITQYARGFKQAKIDDRSDAVKLLTEFKKDTLREKCRAKRESVSC